MNVRRVAIMQGSRDYATRPASSIAGATPRTVANGNPATHLVSMASMPPIARAW
jgi:hypothetical protein